MMKVKIHKNPLVYFKTVINAPENNKSKKLL